MRFIDAINKELKELRKHKKQIKNVITDQGYIRRLDELELMLLRMKRGAK